MKKFIHILVSIFVVGVVSAAAQTDRCYKNDGLKTTNTISFTIKGNRIVDGEFQTGGYDTSTSSEVLGFKGTRSGNTIRVKFTGTTPEEFKRVGPLIWTYSRTTLRVRVYGKNYVTKKCGRYMAVYKKCKEI